MKSLEKCIASIIVYITFLLTYLIPVNKKRVSIISYYNTTPNLEFQRLVSLLVCNNIQVKYDLVKFNSSIIGKFRYLFSFIHQTYLYNTSAVVILDGNSFVYSLIKQKKKVKTVQLWHAIGAIKKFGCQTHRRYNIKAVDLIVVSSELFRPIFADYLNTPLDKVKALGNIKSDYLFDNEYLNKIKESFFKKYPELLNKELILYAPTFRGSGIEDANINLDDINRINEMLAPNQRLIIKLHPLLKRKYNLRKYLDLSHENLYYLLVSSNIIISDYSALIYEASLLKKRIIMHLYDYNDYLNKRGLCVDISEFPFAKSYTSEGLISLINTDNQNIDYSSFNGKYLSGINGESCINIGKEIIEMVNRSV